jgi:hypothetical protein
LKTKRHFDIRDLRHLYSSQQLQHFEQILEKYYAQVAKVLGAKKPVCRLPVELVPGEHECTGNSGGMAFSPEYMHNRHVIAHEIVHVVSTNEWGYGSTFLTEGLAFHLVRRNSFRNLPQDITRPTCSSRTYCAALALRDGNLPPLQELFSQPYFWALYRFPQGKLDSFVSSMAAASFTHYVLETYGLKIYEILNRALDKRSPVEVPPWEATESTQEMEQVLRKSVGEIEQEWHSFICHRGSYSSRIADRYCTFCRESKSISVPSPRTNCNCCGYWGVQDIQQCPHCHGVGGI